jgi:hypothetical protein
MSEMKERQDQQPGRVRALDNATALRPQQHLQLPRLQSVDWLAQTLGLSVGQTYEAISSKKVPADCILRVGRRIRLIEERVIAWILRGDRAGETHYAS